MNRFITAFSIIFLALVFSSQGLTQGTALKATSKAVVKLKQAFNKNDEVRNFFGKADEVAFDRGFISLKENPSGLITSKTFFSATSSDGAGTSISRIIPEIRNDRYTGNGQILNFEQPSFHGASLDSARGRLNGDSIWQQYTNKDGALTTAETRFLALDGNSTEPRTLLQTAEVFIKQGAVKAKRVNSYSFSITKGNGKPVVLGSQEIGDVVRFVALATKNPDIFEIKYIVRVKTGDRTEFKQYSQTIDSRNNQLQVERTTAVPRTLTTSETNSLFASITHISPPKKMNAKDIKFGKTPSKGIDGN